VPVLKEKGAYGMLETEYEVVATVPCTVAVNVVQPLHTETFAGLTETAGQPG